MAVILIVTWLVVFVGKLIIPRLIRVLVKRGKGLKAEQTERQREKTLIGVFYSTFKIAVWVVALLTILPEFGINIGPFLAGVGLVGLALGMGARSIIQDYLAGLFIILEDRYRVGEEIEIAGIQGKVRELNLGRTVLEDGEGTIHSVPNGKIGLVSNLTRSKR